MRFRHLGAVLTVFLLVACAGGERLTGPSSHTADLAFILLGPPGNVIATITVEVTGPGIDSALTFNFPIVSGSASGTARVPAGAGRRLVARAFDAAGVVTHRGDTTVTVVEGTNTSVTLSLQPLIGGQPLTLSFGTNAVAVNRRDTTMTLGDTVLFAAAAVNWRGVAVPADSIVWASSNPAVATVSASGLVTALAAGTAYIVAGYEGTSARRVITVGAAAGSGGGLGLILTETGSGTLTLIRADGSGSLPAPSGLYNADLSYDGLMLVYTRAGAQSLWKSNVDGSGEVTVSTYSAPQYVPRWSRDDLKIVWTREVNFGGAAREIFTMNADGSGVLRLTNNSVMDHEGQWSPDGSQIVFMSQRDGAGDIYVMNADGSGVTRLTTSANTADPEFSPDGQWIVFTASPGGVSGAYLMRVDGTGMGAVVTDPCLNQGESGVHFSPDGTRIVFPACYSASLRDAYTIRLDGTGLMRLTDTPTIDEYVRTWR